MRSVPSGPARPMRALTRLSLLARFVVMAALGGLTLVSLALGAGVTRYFPGIALAGGRWLWVGVAAECLLMGVPVVLSICQKKAT